MYCSTFDLNCLRLKCRPYTSSLEVILASRLVLNLRTHDKPNSSSPSTKTDIFFQNAYGGARDGGDRLSLMDSVLGNIGAPLRVGDEDEDEDYVVEGDEGTQGMELVRTQTSALAAHDEPGIAAQLDRDDGTIEGTERITTEIGGGNEAAIQAQASGELQV